MAFRRFARTLAYAGAVAATMAGGLASCSGTSADDASLILDGSASDATSERASPAPDATSDDAAGTGASDAGGGEATTDAGASDAGGGDAASEAGDTGGGEAGASDAGTSEAGGEDAAGEAGANDAGGGDAAGEAGAGDAGGGDAASEAGAGDAGADAGGPAVLFLSQIQTRGDNGATDEFIEMYNPGSAPVTFDAGWAVKARSAASTLATCASTFETTRFTGGGQVIPAHGHVLFASSFAPAYDGPTAADGLYTIALPDAASVVLTHNGVAVDAVCFYYDATTQAVLTGCATAYTCKGTPALNPHDNTTATNVDSSLERKPGGALGNGIDTQDSASDFQTTNPADPHDLASAPVP